VSIRLSHHPQISRIGRRDATSAVLDCVDVVIDIRNVLLDDLPLNFDEVVRIVRTRAAQSDLGSAFQCERENVSANEHL